MTTDVTSVSLCHVSCGEARPGNCRGSSYAFKEHSGSGRKFFPSWRALTEDGRPPRWAGDINSISIGEQVDGGLPGGLPSAEREAKRRLRREGWIEAIQSGEPRKPPWLRHRDWRARRSRHSEVHRPGGGPASIPSSFPSDRVTGDNGTPEVTRAAEPLTGRTYERSTTGLAAVDRRNAYGLLRGTTFRGTRPERLRPLTLTA